MNLCRGTNQKLLIFGRDRGNRTVMSTRTDRARDAVTHFEVVERLPRTALLRVRLETGRTHQIRTHLAAIDHPVVGDPLYGGVRWHIAGDLRAVTHLDRPFLHAARLVFVHPIEKRKMEFTVELPDDLQAVLDELRTRRWE